jgi:demethylmenaquinone methyltransferase / 2-methoxy-6-polyprenyl-1,4-benzoquinol methylase
MKDGDERPPAKPFRLGDLDVASHLRDPSRKQAFVTPMFDIIAPRYDAFTRLFSFGMDARWKRAAIEACMAHEPDVTSGGSPYAPRFLDLATGTGDLAIALAHRVPDARVIALDASVEMIRHANQRLMNAGGATVRTLVGDMGALPIASASMDLVMAGYGVRNVPSAPLAVAEMRRVLQPGGRLVLLDFYRPEQPIWRTLLLRYLQLAGNVVGWWWHRDPVVYGYIAHSIEHFMSWQACSALLEAHGFRVVRVTRYLGGGVARHEAVAM